MDPHSLVLYCKFRDQRVPFTLHKDTCYADLVRVLCDRFNLDPSSVSLVYMIRSEERNYLRTNEELSDMRSLLYVLGQRMVDLVVCDDSSSVGTSLVSVASSALTLDDEVDGWEAESSLVVLKKYKTSEWVTCITGVGQVFEGGVAEFRNALRKYCVSEGREAAFEKNYKKKLYAFCKYRAVSHCGWFVKASYRGRDGHFAIRQFNPEHTCEKMGPVDPNKLFNSKLVADCVKDVVRVDPKCRASSVITSLRREYGLNVTYYKAWDGVNKARIMNFGDVGDSYNQLESYLDALKDTNPGSRVVLEFEDGTRTFRRLFFSFGACIEGFKHVRPLLFVDGTFLKGKKRGTLLSAVGKNGNRGLYPLAFAIVDVENIVNWTWFLLQLKLTISKDHPPITFLSDRHVGLLEGMSRVFPDSTHCFCLQHLKANMKTRFSGTDANKSDLVQQLQSCATAPTVALFDKELEMLFSMGGSRMQDFIADIELDRWTEAYCKVCRYGETTSNAVEAFNSWILDIRGMSITEMIDMLRVKIMKWFDERKTNSGKWKDFLCAHYAELWRTSLHNSLGWEVRRASPFKFEVLSNPSHCVDLIEKKCTCYQWKFHGFPCRHAIYCIEREKLPVKDYVEKWFWAETYRKSYDLCINPVPTCLWRDSGLARGANIRPPDVEARLGRPPEKRHMTINETLSRKKQVIYCGTCRQTGHNRRSCPERVGQEKLPVRCGRCRQLGHNRLKCSAKSPLV